MRRFSKILIPALLVVAVVVSCMLMFTSAAGTPEAAAGETVVYIASTAKGTGDGSSAENAMGNAADYNPAAKDVKKNAFYLALTANDSALIKNGGVIVICDEFAIDTCDGCRTSYSEFEWPKDSSNQYILGTKNITITSYYNGVDYRQTGAKLVLDTSKYGINWRIKAPTTWEYLNIDAVYDSSRPNHATPEDSTMMLSFHGNKTVMDEELVVTPKDISAGDKKTYYPTLAAFDRYYTDVVGKTSDTDITINSGSWGRVFGTVFGLYVAPSTQYGELTGNVSITVNGGSVQTINGVSSSHDSNLKYGHTGNVSINLNGGEVNTVYGCNKNGINGKIEINVAKTVTGLKDVYSYYPTGSNSEAAPADATISFDRSNLPESKVYYFTTVNATGEEVIPPPPPVASDVIYVAANGTGDGSSPESPLGNDSTYYDLLGSATESVRNTAYTKNAFYLAFQKLAANGGTIVLVGDVTIDTCASRIPTAEGLELYPSEFLVPVAGGEVVITSVYDGNDYRSDAKLVFDLDKCNTTFLQFSSPVTFENVNIEHKYDPDDLNKAKTPFGISAFGKRFVIGTGVNVTSLNADTNGEGDLFPMILGGDRWQNVSSTDVTIKSGTWEAVIAGGRGSDSSNCAVVQGTASVTIEGGKIGKVSGTGSLDAAYSTVLGKSTITVTGGEVDRLYFANQVVYNGNGSVVTIGENAGVKFADYAAKGYKGNLDDLKSLVTFNIENGLVLGVEPPREPDVVYVSDKGTGDGSSPDSPLGTPSDYTVADMSFKKTAFYKAMEMLKEYGGYIVVVGDTAIDSAESRVEGTNKDPSELHLPELGGELIITSVYNGVDYRENGAKLILDQDACSVAFVTFKSDVKFENLDILHKYNLSDVNKWGTPMAIAANGNKLVVESTVTVSAWDAAKNLEGNWYPMILGGHRYMDISGNTDVTIRGGNWSAVYAASYGMSSTYKGNVTGNATLNIEGGKVESVYGTTSLDKSYGSVGGKLEINVTGGSVDAIYASAKNGADNEIVVNVAATADRVAKIWGGVSESTIPANITVSYDRSVTRDDEVKYVNPETTIITGSEEDQPEPIYFTLYVANVERGRGDGSSPENAIGHAPDYASHRAQALAIITANGGNNNNLSKENGDIVYSVYKKNALYRALSMNGNKLVNQGGVLVICDVLTIDTTDAMRKTFAEFKGPAGAETITVTSIHDGVDYRAKGARLVLDTSDVGLCLELASPMVFDHLNIEHRYNSKNGKSIDNGALITANGNKLTIGYDVYVWANDINPDEAARVDIFPSICGGHRYSDSNADCYVSVGSGTWAAVVGGDWGSKHTGNATIGINGGKIGTVCGTSKPTASGAKNIFDGSAWIGLWGGEVDNVIVVAKPGMKWGDASIGLGGTKVNGKIRATHADYSGEEIQAWVFNYTDEQIDTEKVIGFESPVPATGSYMGYVVAVAVVSLAGIVLLIGKKRSRNED